MDAEKPRVAVFRNNFLPYSETFIHDELRFHERYGATVFCRQQRNRDRFPGHDVVAVETIPDDRRTFASAVYGLFARSGRIDRALAARRFALVHAHFGHNGVYAMPFAARHRLPLVVSLHGRDVTALLGRDRYLPEWWIYLAFHRRLFAQADLFLAASTELAELFKGLGCPADKVRVHRLGVDLSLFSPAPADPPAGLPRVVMVGRFVEKKGHRYGIEASARAARAGFLHRLVVVGDGPLEAGYRKQAASLGIAESLELPGALPHAEVSALLRRAAVVIAPSVVAKNLDRESGIIVLKEAAACGVPSIGTRHGGIPDIIEDGVTGYLVEERDVETLAARLIAILGDGALRRRLGLAALEKMRREYDLRERVRALEAIYDEVVARAER